MASPATMPDRPTTPTPRRSRSSPYLTIAKILRSAIETGRLKPGDQLPTVVELAAQHGVAAGTAHRALAALTTEGLVDVARGRRATVRAQRGEPLA